MGHVTLAVLLVTLSAAVGARRVSARLIDRSAIESSLQSSPPASSQAGPRSAPARSDVDAKMREGGEAFRNGDYPRALAIFREVIAAAPDNIFAHNLAANCALRLKDYPGAIDSFKHALELQPDELHNLTGLMEAYTLAGMTEERDAEREHIQTLKREGRLPKGFGYLFETFEVGEKKVQVTEFPAFGGRYNFRYLFKVLDKEDKLAFQIALESADFDQGVFAKLHPKDAAAGQREFSLDGFGPNAHWTYGFYDGEPPYEQVRERVEQILLGKTKPLSSTTMNTRKMDSTPGTPNNVPKSRSPKPQ